jgi:hypothetical protein
MTRIRVGLGEATTPMRGHVRARRHEGPASGGPWLSRCGVQVGWDEAAATVMTTRPAARGRPRVSRDESEEARPSRHGARDPPRGPGGPPAVSGRPHDPWPGEWAMMWRGLTREGTERNRGAASDWTAAAGLFEAIQLRD